MLFKLFCHYISKILNVEKQCTIKFFLSEEIKKYIYTWVTIGTEEDSKALKFQRYHKVIIMCDADVDGSHFHFNINIFLQIYGRN
jgi:DNA gyrase/topoisomerase IV subunit B